MKVRAIKDGTYGGYFREGPTSPIPGVSHGTDGEVFEIDEKPVPAIDPESGQPIMEQVRDAHGNLMFETLMIQAVDEKGNPVVGPDKKPLLTPVQRPKLKQRMWNWFSADWMEKVPDDTPITYEENERPRGVHPSMRIKKHANAGKPRALSELQEELGKPIAEEPVTI